MRHSEKATIALCSLAAAGAWAQPGVDPASVCSPIVTKGVTERYLESNQLFRKKILSQVCSDQQMTAEKARSQGLDLNVVIEGVPLGAAWSDDQNERTSARNKLCKMDFSDVRNESYVRLLERVPVPHLVTEYKRCVELVLTSSAEMTCSLTGGDPQFSTLHITYHPKSTAPNPRASNTLVQGGYMVGGAADVEYTRLLDGWRKTRGASNTPAPTPPSSDVIFPNGTEIKVGSTFVDLVRNDGKPLTVNVGNSRAIPCRAQVDPTDEVKLDVLLVPHGKNTVVRNSVKQLRAEAGCSADGGVLHERQYCTDDGATLENFAHHVVSAGSPRDASYIEKSERKGNCVTV